MVERSGISTQLKVQILVMLTAAVIGVSFFVYTYGFDRWRGPLARREYYELGDHDVPVDLPEFARTTPTPQALIDVESLDSGETANLIRTATDPSAGLQPSDGAN